MPRNRFFIDLDSEKLYKLTDALSELRRAKLLTFKGQHAAEELLQDTHELNLAALF